METSYSNFIWIYQLKDCNFILTYSYSLYAVYSHYAYLIILRFYLLDIPRILEQLNIYLLSDDLYIFF